MQQPAITPVDRDSITTRLKRAAFNRTLTFRTKRLIVFLTPGLELRTGGVLSIVAIHRASKALRSVHRARVALCTVPGDPLLSKYTWFDNHDYMLGLESVLASCRKLDYLLLQIPDYAVNRVLEWLASPAGELVKRAREVHLNVLLQNIDQIAGQDVAGLKRFGKVTCTTAHEAYTNLASREKLGVPLHRLSVCLGPELYSRSGYDEKESLLVVSHDEHPLKHEVLEKLSRECPTLKIEIVHDLRYEDYKKLMSRAKWSLTFGEGLDAYFLESVWSGGVPFAVFNTRFFTPAFAELETVYSSWEILMQNMARDLQRLDEPAAYTGCWQQAYDLLNTLYGTERFYQNLKAFYRGEYTFP